MPIQRTVSLTPMVIRPRLLENKFLRISDIYVTKMKYARIVFDDEHNLTRTVLVIDIKFKRGDKTCIEPSDGTDFIKGHKYYIKYYFCTRSGDTCHENHEHEFRYYAAYIYALGDSIEELMEKEKSGPRKTFPNKKYADTSSSTLSESNSSEQNPKENKEQAYKRVRVNRLENIIKQVKQKNKNLQFYEDSDSESTSDNETTHMKQKRTRTQIESELLHSMNHIASHKQLTSNNNNTSKNVICTSPSLNCTTDVPAITNPLGTQPLISHQPSATTEAVGAPDTVLQSL